MTIILIFIVNIILLSVGLEEEKLIKEDNKAKRKNSYGNSSENTDSSSNNLSMKSNLLIFDLFYSS